MHLGGLERRLQLGIHALDDRLRRAARRIETRPVADLHARIALLRRGRDGGIDADALYVGRRDRLQQSGLDLGQHDDARLGRRRDIVRQNGVHSVAAAFVRDDREGDAGRLLDHLGHEFRRAAVASRGPVDAFTALRFGPGDELGHVIRRHARMHNDGRRRDRDHADRHQIGIGIGKIFQQQAVGDGTRRADQKGVAVGRGMSDERGTDHRAGARPIFDDNRLPEALSDALGRKSSDQVIGAAGPEPHDPADGVIRPLRACRRRSECANKNGSGENYGPFYHCFLLRSGASLVASLPLDKAKVPYESKAEACRGGGFRLGGLIKRWARKPALVKCEIRRPLWIRKRSLFLCRPMSP